VAREFPVEYVKICVSILPKDTGVGDGKDPDKMLEAMRDEQLYATMDMLQRLIRAEKMLAQEIKRPGLTSDARAAAAGLTTSEKALNFLVG
jgi:hypothetical protein